MKLTIDLRQHNIRIGFDPIHQPNQDIYGTAWHRIPPPSLFSLNYTHKSKITKNPRMSKLHYPLTTKPNGTHLSNIRSADELQLRSLDALELPDTVSQLV